MLRHLRLAALSAHDESIPTVDAGRVAALSVRKRKSDKGLLPKRKSERQASIQMSVICRSHGLTPKLGKEHA